MPDKTRLSADMQPMKAPDGGWGWVVVFSSFMIHFIIDGITYSMGDIYLEPMLSTLAFSRGYVSAIFSFLESITLASAPISTVFTNTFGCRTMTITGAVLASFGFFLSRWWSNVYYYYLTIGIVSGIGCGLLYLPALVSVGYYFEEKRSFAVGIAVCGSGLGTVAFPFVLPWLIRTVLNNNYRDGLLLESCLIFACVGFGLLMIPLPIEPSEQRRLRIKLKEKAMREAGRTLAKTDEATQQVTQPLDQFESAPFLIRSKTNAEEKESAPEERRHATISFNNVHAVGPSSRTLDDHGYRSLSRLPPVSRHSIVAIQNSSLYQGSLNRMSLASKAVGESGQVNETKEPLVKSERESSPTDTSSEDELPESIFASLVEQINLKLLKNRAFTLFTISNFLSSLGFFVPYNFAHDLAKDCQVEESHRKLVIMAIGFSHCLGHIVIGYLADLKSVNRLSLYNSTLIIAGIATIVAPYSGSNVVAHIVYGSFFGFFTGGYVGLTSVITVDLVGIDRLSNGMGIILLFQGVATAIGTPAAGAMRDAFERHTRPFLWPYFMFGGVIVLSGAILFAIPMLIRRDKPSPILDESDANANVTFNVEDSHSRREKPA